MTQPAPHPIPTLIYKICPAALWHPSERIGTFSGSEVDLRDGYIHFSTAAQVSGTARMHFGGQSNLYLIAVETMRLGNALRWEPARGGELFPHLYVVLDMRAVRWVKPLPLGADGEHEIPDLSQN